MLSDADAVMTLVLTVSATALLNVPRLVRLDAVTPLARVEPVSVPAAAGTVMFAEPSKLTPLIVRAVDRIVAFAAVPANCVPELCSVSPKMALMVALSVLETGMVVHVPSPRHHVEALALVPEFRCEVARLPVTPPLPLAARLIAPHSTRAESMSVQTVLLGAMTPG